MTTASSAAPSSHSDAPAKPKVKAMALIYRTHPKTGDLELLATPGFDHQKQTPFFRLIGGHVEMGETAADAVLREIKEELGINMTIAKPLGWLENIFTYNGGVGHELIALFETRFTSPNDIQDAYHFTEHNQDGTIRTYTAAWVNIAAARQSSTPIYPLLANSYIQEKDKT
jgi:8-oxo-dGTP pyrophosphatase MutT (NUDIX family)